MTAFELIQPDGSTKKVILRTPSKLVLRNNHSAVENEFKLLKLLKKCGLPVPNPLHWNHSPFPYILLDYIEGNPLFPSHPENFFPHQVANHLVQVHKTPINSPELKFLPSQSQRLKNLLVKAPLPENNLMQEAQIKILLKRHWPIHPLNSVALVHGDFWHGNLIWKDNCITGIIDWEDAELGSPLFDLAVSRLDLCWISGIDTMNSFTEHYMSQMDLDYSLLPCWDLVAALRLIRLAGSDLKGWASFFYQYERMDITEESILKHFDFFLNQAFNNLKSI